MLFWCFLRCRGLAPLFAGASRLGKQLKDVAGGKFSMGVGLNPNLHPGSPRRARGGGNPQVGAGVGDAPWGLVCR